jgi:hypothetical protein
MDCRFPERRRATDDPAHVGAAVATGEPQVAVREGVSTDRAALSAP